MKDTLLNATVSGNTTSEILNLEQHSKFSIQANILSGITGAIFKLQASIDGVNWVDVHGSITSIIGADNIIWDVIDQSYDYVRVDISSVVGSANIEIISKKKE